MQFPESWLREYCNPPITTAALADTLTMAGLAMVLFQSGDVRGALAQWRLAVDADPANFDALYNLAVQSQRILGDEAARPILERFVATAPRAQYGNDIAEIEAMLRRTRAK